jgi:hypothetical protein
MKTCLVLLMLAYAWLGPAAYAQQENDDSPAIASEFEQVQPASYTMRSPGSPRAAANRDAWGEEDNTHISSPRQNIDPALRRTAYHTEERIPSYQRAPRYNSPYLVHQEFGSGIVPDDFSENPCQDCSVRCNSTYIRAEYLSWWLTGANSPTLVTTSAPGTALSSAGVLGVATTSVLFGNEDLSEDQRHGGRIVFGKYLGGASRLEGEFFGIASDDETYAQASSGSPILARPFFNLSTGAPDAFIVAYPGVRVGEIAVSNSNEFLGAGVQLSRSLGGCDAGCHIQRRLSFLYGFRFLRFNEDLSIRDRLTSIDPQAVVPVGTQFATQDDFSTTNSFYGANLGVMLERQGPEWDFTGSLRFALGGTSQHASISGFSSTTTPGGAVTNFNGGLLALPTNIGDYHKNNFVVIPQLELKLGYKLSEDFKFTVGYDFLYWSKVFRAAEQIDPFVNPSQASGQALVGTPGPRYATRESDLLVQGISLGFEWTY